MQNDRLPITLFVILIHFILLGFLCTGTEKTFVAPPSKLAVQTLTLRPPPLVSLPKKEPSKISEKNQQKAQPKPKPKKPTTSKRKKEKPIVTKKKNPVIPKNKKPENSTNRQKLLEEALAQLDNLTESSTPIATLPSSSLTTLQINKSGSTQGNYPPYCEELVRRLRLSLRLPEQDSVQLELTLDRNGALTKLNVGVTQSTKNRSYLEAEIPKLHFPPFGTAFPGEQRHAFVLILEGEEDR